MKKEDAAKQFCKLITKFYRHDRYQVFCDFCEVAAISLRQPFLRSEKLENSYLATMNRYEPVEKNIFPEMLSLVIEGLQDEHHDFLGGVFHSLELANKDKGQFFTPYHVSLMMAQMTLQESDIREKLKTQNFITINDPACGAGGMLIAVDHVFRQIGINPQQNLLVVGQDIDKKCCNMAYIQLSLLGTPGYVIYGNTLSDGKDNEVWHTVGHFISQLRFSEIEPRWMS